MTIKDRFKIRPLHKSDYDGGIIELLSQLTMISKDKISRENFNEYVELISKNDNQITIVVEDYTNHQCIVGVSTIFIEPKLIHNISFVGHIEDVVVDERYRGYGIGKMMITYLLNKGRASKCYKVILDCEEKKCIVLFKMWI